MSTAANRNPQVIFPAEANGGHDVGHVGAPGDEPRLAADHSVVNFPLFLIAGVGWLDQLSPELAAKLVDRVLL